MALYVFQGSGSKMARFTREKQTLKARRSLESIKSHNYFVTQAN